MRILREYNCIPRLDFATLNNASERSPMRLSQFRYKAVQAITRLPIPGYRRIYCADPNIAFLGIPLIDLQLACLQRGVQLIVPKRNEAQSIAHTDPSDEFHCTDDHFEGISVMKVAEYSILVDLEAQLDELPVLAKTRASVFAHYRSIAVRSIRFLTRELDRFKPDAVLLAQGYGIQACATRLLSIKKDISIIAVENTALKNQMLWDVISGVTVNQNMARNVFWRYQDVVLPEEAATFCAGIRQTTKHRKQQEHASPECVWTSSSRKPMVLYLGQVFTDSSLLYGCHPHFGPIQVIHTLCVWADQNDVDVFIKLHPKEVSGLAPVTARPYKKLTFRKLTADDKVAPFLERGRVTVDDENHWDTYKLIDKADVVVTINSQAGLEAAMRGKNVITCGKCFYGNSGFTCDVETPRQLEHGLDKWQSAGYSPQKHQAAEKFFYVFFAKYCITKSKEGLAQLLRRQASAGFPFRAALLNRE